MASQAFSMIGAESVVIGELTLSCVLSEAEQSKDFSTGGFEVINRLQAVCLTSDLPSASILKRAATARGISFRVESIRKGGDFTTITLEQVEKA